MVSKNTLSELACQSQNSSIDVNSILQRITPIQFIPNMDIRLEEIPMIQTGMLTGPSMGTLTIQSYLDCLELEADNAYIHKLKTDTIVIGGITGPFYTGPTGPLGIGLTGMTGTFTNTGAVGPTGPTAYMNPLVFLSPSGTSLSITDPSPTVIRNNVTFDPGMPLNGFEKTIINGYTGTNLLSPLTNSIGSMLNNVIYATQVVGNTVYLGGAFTRSNDGIIDYPYIAKWDEQNGLQQVNGPTGPNGFVYSMAYDASKSLLYVGGNFTSWANVNTSPRAIGAWNVSTQSFQSLGITGLTGPTSRTQCLCMTANSTNTLYTGWTIAGVTQDRNLNIVLYDNYTWKGCTGAITSRPKKIVVDDTHNIMYVGYDLGTPSTPISRFNNIYSINPTTGTNTSIYIGGSAIYSTMALDNTDKLYIGVKTASTIAPLPFQGKSYMSTYTYGSTGTTPFLQVTTPIDYLVNDKNNNVMYICANTVNSTLSTIIDQKEYQGIVSFDGTSFRNIADLNVYQYGLLTPLSASKLMISPYPDFTSGTTINQFQRSPARTSATNTAYIAVCGKLNKDASLSITAPINYYTGQTGNYHTLYTIGDKVVMKWDSTTNSWWI